MHELKISYHDQRHEFYFQLSMSFFLERNCRKRNKLVSMSKRNILYSRACEYVLVMFFPFVWKLHVKVLRLMTTELKRRIKNQLKEISFSPLGLCPLFYAAKRIKRTITKLT